MQQLDKSLDYVYGFWQISYGSEVAQEFQDVPEIPVGQRWTHCGVLFFSPEGKWKVVETNREGVVECVFPHNLDYFKCVGPLEAYPATMALIDARSLVGAPFPGDKVFEALHTFAFSGVRWEPDSYTDITCGRLVHAATKLYTKHNWPCEYQLIGRKRETIRIILWRDGDIYVTEGSAVRHGGYADDIYGVVSPNQGRGK